MTVSGERPANWKQTNEGRYFHGEVAAPNSFSFSRSVALER